MNPIADLRAAVLSLSFVPDQTPVEPGFVYGSPSIVAYDSNAGIVRVNVGGGRATGRPNMGQLRTWLGLPSATALPAATPPTLSGPWDSLIANEPFTLRGALTFISAIASGYHGVTRNGGSIFWGLIWFAAGAALPGFVPIVAVAQGYGTCANNCRQSATEHR
jgi:hypothetical protein